MSRKINYSKLEEKHYPIGWKIEGDEIKVWDINSVDLPRNHVVHRIERNFIEEQITKYLTFSGSIECI